MLDTLTLIGLSLFDMFGFGGAESARPSFFVVSGRITMKFCTGIDHQSPSSNVKKDLHKMNDIIILRPLSVVQKYTTNAIKGNVRSKKVSSNERA